MSCQHFITMRRAYGGECLDCGARLDPLGRDIVRDRAKAYIPSLSEARHDRALISACRPERGPVVAHCETCDAPTPLRTEDPYHIDFGLCLWCKGYDITLKVPDAQG
jgi:hypothetical protein